MNDKIMIDVPRDTKSGYYKHELFFIKSDSGKFYLSQGKIKSVGASFLAKNEIILLPVEMDAEPGIDFCFIGVGFFVVLCGIGLLLAFTKGAP